MVNILDKCNNYKIAFLGHSGAGKSSIVLRFVKDHWYQDITSTIGASFHQSKVNVNNQTINLDIWDTAGQERYNSLAPIYYRSSKAIIVVFDIMDEFGFENSKKWIKEVTNLGKLNPIIFLVANKIDMYKKDNSLYLIKHEIAAQYAIDNNLFYTEVSAKEGTGIMELFHDIANYLYESENNNKKIEKVVSVSDLVTKDNMNTIPYNRCC